jgi:methyltransferase
VPPQLSQSVELYLALIVLVALERLAELYLSARNARRAQARGGVEAESRAFYAAMVALHAGFLVAAPLEVVYFERRFEPLLGYPMLALAALAMALRWWAIASLGERWNTRVVVVPGEAAVAGGPYRFLRHPNYLAVIVEIAALPLVHGAWATALAFSTLNAVVLSRRIAHEELALARLADYPERFGPKARLWPGFGPRSAR